MTIVKIQNEIRRKKKEGIPLTDEDIKFIEMEKLLIKIMKKKLKERGDINGKRRK